MPAVQRPGQGDPGQREDAGGGRRALQACGQGGRVVLPHLLLAAAAGEGRCDREPLPGGPEGEHRDHESGRGRRRKEGREEGDVAVCLGEAAAARPPQDREAVRIPLLRRRAVASQERRQAARSAASRSLKAAKASPTVANPSKERSFSPSRWAIQKTPFSTTLSFSRTL